MANPNDVVPESRRPALGEWFNEAVFRALGKVRVCMPGRVKTFDPATQLAQVEPLLRDLQRNSDGSTESVSLPVLNGVPLVMPQGGGRQIKLPISAGDVVLLVFADRSLDIWKSKGGEVDPVDLRQHHLSDAVAIPCFRDPAAAAPSSTIEIKADGGILLGPGAAQGVGLGDNLRTELDAIWSAIYGGHVHAGVTAGAASTAPAAGAPAKQTVSSAVVKVIP